MVDILSPELSELIKQSLLFAHEEKKRNKSVIERPFVRESLRDGRFVSLIHMSQGTFPNTPDPSSPPLAVYNVKLVRTTGQPHWELVNFWLTPKTVLDVKRRVENQLNIPVSTQTVRFQDRVLIDSTSLSRAGISDKSVIEIRYFSAADKEQVWAGFCWFDFVHRLHLGRRSNIWTGLPAEVEFIVNTGLEEDLPQQLAAILCRGCSEDRGVANREYFDQLGGVKTVALLYQQLGIEDWRTLPLPLKLVEAGCIRVLSEMAPSSNYHFHLAKLDIIGFVERSFLRVKIRRGVVVRDLGGAPGSQEHNDFLAIELMKSSLVFMTKIWGRPKLHEDVSSSSDLLEQLINLAHSPSFSTSDAQSAICVIGSALWYTSDRQWITKSSVLEGISEVGRARRKAANGDEEKELVSLEFFVQLFLAAVIMTSTLQLRRRIFDKLEHLMDAFLSQVSFSTLILKDQLTFSPLGHSPLTTIIKLLYPPPEENAYKSHIRYSKEERALLSRLRELSTESLLLALEVSIERSPHSMRVDLQERELTEFFLCLPFRLPFQLKWKGRQVVRLLYSKTVGKVPVPTLEGITRSFLACKCFGAREILGRTVNDISSMAKTSSKKRSIYMSKFK